MHRHAVEYSTYPRGPRSGPGCSVPRRPQILLRNNPSSGTISRLYQRSRARRSATISDRRSAFVSAAYTMRWLLPFSARLSPVLASCAATATDPRPRKAFQTATTLQCLRHRHFLAVWQPLHRGPCSALKKCGQPLRHSGCSVVAVWNVKCLPRRVPGASGRGGFLAR